MNMCPSQVSPQRTPGSNEYVPLAGVPSKNTRAFTCSYQFNPLKLIHGIVMMMADEMVAVVVCGGDGEASWRRVVARDMGDQVDRVTRNLFGFGWKSLPEKFSGGGGSSPEKMREREW
ncbi:hypothetical protein Tco_1091352 [Tanacetum coccineum]|uniref:Uncharacterized protein n=1 Tax=Tanacetum coccineum TaxID=301880 RepID=A0ABQ5I800_9ASTR